MSLPEDKPCPTLPLLKQFKCYTNCRDEMAREGFEEDDICGKSPGSFFKDDESKMTMATPNKPNVCDNEEIAQSCHQETCLDDTILDSEDHSNNIENKIDKKSNEVEGDSSSQLEMELNGETEVKHKNNVPTPRFRLEDDNEENEVLENDKVKEKIIPECEFLSCPFPRNKRKDIWLCIPGKLKQIRKVNFEPARAFEVDKMKEQLLCRPASGLGQNWFQLNIGKRTRCFEDMYFIRNSIPYQMDDVKVKQKDVNKKIFKFDVSDSNGSWLLKNFPPYSRFLSFVENECNNSNGIQHGSTSSQRQSESLTGRVIRVEGDGRCLFRSLVTCMSSDLQKVRRDDFGCALRKEDAHCETHMADVLRAKVVNLMKDNAHFYGQLERVVINADQPMPSGYIHFRERLDDMTLASTMPGDLELNAVSTVLKKQVHVVDTNLRPVVVYGKERYPQSKIVTVRYTRLGPDVGHYDAVILDRVYDFGPTTKTNDGENEHSAISQTSVLDYFTDLISKFKISSDEHKDVSRADFGVQFPSEKDLSHINEANLNRSKNHPSVMERNESNHDKNMNKCQNPMTTESDDERGRLESDGEVEDDGVRIDECDDGGVFSVTKNPDDVSDLIKDTDVFYVIENDANTTNRNGSDGEVEGDGVRIDECDDGSVFYVTKNPDHLSDLIKDTDVFYVIENDADTTNRNCSRNFDSEKFTNEQLLRAQVIEKKYYDKENSTSKNGQNNRKRKVKTERHEGPRTKKRKASFKVRKISRRCFSLPRRMNGKHNRNKTRRSRDSMRVTTKYSPRLGAKRYRRLNTYNVRVVRRQNSASPRISQKAHTLPKYFSEIQNPSGFNPSGCRTCFVCCKPISLARHHLSVCILCGRTAHRECVDPSRKEHGGKYSLCWYCVPE